MAASRFAKEIYTVNVFSLPEPYAFFDVLTRKPDYHLAPHSHGEFHVNYITDGSVEIITAAGNVTAGAGYAFVMPPDTEHELFSASGYSQIGMDVQNIQDRYGLVRKLHEIGADKVLLVKVSDPELKDSITEDMLFDMSPITALKCVTNMTRLALHIIENAEKNADSSFASEFRRIAQEYDGRNVDLSELCHRFSFSKTHLERLTKREFGCSAVEYFERMRFSKVCSLLAVTDKTLSVIAEECGFCDSSHLSVFFKKRSGMTCIAYRNLAK